MNAAAAGSRPGLHRQAVRLEQFSIAWMLIEAGVAVTAGIIAGSLALTSFGFDSVIELVSAVLVLRRLHAEPADGQPDERAERRVLQIIAVTFFVLAAYVLIGSVIDLATGAHPEHSPVGIVLTISSLLVMPLLGWRKRRCAQFRLVDNPFSTTLHSGSSLPLTITFTPTCEFNPCCELVICTDDPEHERSTLLVTGHLRRTLATAIKCWAGQEIRDMIAGGGKDC